VCDQSALEVNAGSDNLMSRGSPMSGAPGGRRVGIGGISLSGAPGGRRVGIGGISLSGEPGGGRFGIGGIDAGILCEGRKEGGSPGGGGGWPAGSFGPEDVGHACATVWVPGCWLADGAGPCAANCLWKAAPSDLGRGIEHGSVPSFGGANDFAN